MARKKLVKDLSGNIIDWFDETKGGWIIQKRQIVNQSAWEDHLRIQQDRVEAAKAESMQVSRPDAPDRSVAPSKVEALEKKVEGMESKLDQILKALNNKQ